MHVLYYSEITLQTIQNKLLNRKLWGTSLMLCFDGFDQNRYNKTRTLTHTTQKTILQLMCLTVLHMLSNKACNTQLKSNKAYGIVIHYSTILNTYSKVYALSPIISRMCLFFLLKNHADWMPAIFMMIRMMMPPARPGQNKISCLR